MSRPFFVLVLIFQCGVCARDCIVDTLSVQSNFDFEKYMGLWYGISLYSDTGSQMDTWMIDYTEHYVQTGDGNATGYTSGRESVDPVDCSYGAHYLRSTGTPGKLLSTANGSTIPYWVLETDYTQYALVYGCNNVLSDGTCSGARAWIFSRTTTLPQNITGRIPYFHEITCIPSTSFQSVTVNKTCDFNRHQKLREDQDCSVANLQVQENFDFSMFSGEWHLVKSLSPRPDSPLFYASDSRRHHIITEDGNMTVYSYIRMSWGKPECYTLTSKLLKTSTPGKLLASYPHGSILPYWVLKTDYTQYAVEYGCYDLNSDGTCDEAVSRIWSRSTGLPKSLEYELNTFLQDKCINPSAYTLKKNDNECPVEPFWTVEDEMDCNVTSFIMKTDFNVNMFTRVWYETRWLPEDYLSPSELSTDRQEELFTDDEGNLVARTRHRKSGVCKYMSASYKATSSPGKFLVSMSSGESFQYWVADTDYETYAVMYGCERVGSDGGCVSARGSEWSRSPTLAPHLQYRVNSVLQELCINPSAFLTIQHEKACPPKDTDCPVPTQASGSFSEAWIHTTLIFLCLLLH